MARAASGLPTDRAEFMLNVAPTAFRFHVAERPVAEYLNPGVK